MGRLPHRHAGRAAAEAELRTRKNQDYTERFAEVARELPKALRSPDCVVDGEVCALDEEGRPSFSAMQQRAPGTPIVYYLFDLLELDGEPLVDLPLEERHERLEALLEPNRCVKLSAAFDDGDALLERGEGSGPRGRDGEAPRLAYLRASARTTG